MLTNREVYSRTINEIKAFGIDLWVSPKYVLGKARDILADFLSKDNNSNLNLYKLSEGWIEIDGLPLEVVPVSECNLGTDVCERLMKTKQKLPDTFSARYGNLIRQVASEDFSHFYEPTTPRGWKNIQKRQDKSSKKYYFFIGGYIYIPIPKGTQQSPEKIRVEALFYHPWEIQKLEGTCEDCKKECKSPLDYVFTSPNYLLDDVLKETTKQIAQVYLKVNKDPYPNENELDRQPPKQG